MTKQRSKLKASDARRLAVLAECDPRTVRRVFTTGEVPTITSERVVRVLEAEGFWPNPGEAQP